MQFWDHLTYFESVTIFGVMINNKVNGKGFDIESVVNSLGLRKPLFWLPFSYLTCLESVDTMF